MKHEVLLNESTYLKWRFHMQSAHYQLHQQENPSTRELTKWMSHFSPSADRTLAPPWSSFADFWLTPVLFALSLCSYSAISNPSTEPRFSPLPSDGRSPLPSDGRGPFGAACKAYTLLRLLGTSINRPRYKLMLIVDDNIFCSWSKNCKAWCKPLHSSRVCAWRVRMCNTSRNDFEDAATVSGEKECKLWFAEDAAIEPL